MREHMIYLLLLTTLALSPSDANMLIPKDTQAPSSRSNSDNTYIRQATKNILISLFCKPRIDSFDIPRLCTFLMDNNGGNLKDLDNYNWEGYRKEQWHNYPRQLDRLQDNYHERHKMDITQDPFKSPHDTDRDIIIDNDGLTNEALDSNDNTPTIYEQKSSEEPMIILNIDQLEQDVGDKISLSNLGEQELVTNDLNTAIQMLKLKRRSTDEDSTWEPLHPEHQNLAVNKRIFSLWSRLQGLSPKGHELHHRRHLHAYYNIPDTLGLTADTRSMVRPQGSPLRWG